MVKEIVNTGLSPNDGSGDDLRSSFQKINNNFTELYDSSSITSNLDFSSNSIVSTNTNGQIILDPQGTGDIILSANTSVVGTLNVSGPVTFDNNLLISGNLDVTGTTTQIQTVNLQISDPLLVLNSNESGVATFDTGFIVERGTTDNVGFIYDESLDEFAVINTSEIGTTSGNVTITTYANLQAANITGTLLTGDQPNITTLAGLSSFTAGNLTVGGSTISDILTNDNFTISTTGSGTLELVANTNITGTLSVTGDISGTLATAAQGNITSLGTLTSLTVDQITIDGLIISSNQTNANIELDPSGTGNLVLLSGNLELGAADINSTGNVIVNNITGANITGTLLTAAQTNITSVGSLTALTMAGNIAMAGNDITGATNIAGTLTTAAQTNITSVGTLTSLIVTPGDITGKEIAIQGNSIVTLNTNANLELVPAGTGKVSFGTFTSTGDTATNGYVEILDSTGTIRRLATVA